MKRLLTFIEAKLSVSRPGFLSCKSSGGRLNQWRVKDGYQSIVCLQSSSSPLLSSSSSPWSSSPSGGSGWSWYVGMLACNPQVMGGYRACRSCNGISRLQRTVRFFILILIFYYYYFNGISWLQLQRIVRFLKFLINFFIIISTGYLGFNALCAFYLNFQNF